MRFLTAWPHRPRAHAGERRGPRCPGQGGSGAARALTEPFPARVELWFSERLEPAYSRASVTNEAGAQIDLRDVAVSKEDPKRLSLSLPLLVPGRYTVRFRVLSVDGHVVESSLTFTVKSPR